MKLPVDAALEAVVKRDRLFVVSALTAVIALSWAYLLTGAYQLTPIKHACLRRCRSPLSFLVIHWRRNARGVLRIGLAMRPVSLCWSGVPGYWCSRSDWGMQALGRLFDSGQPDGSTTHFLNTFAGSRLALEPFSGEA
jgi:hypothetical protein